MYKPMGLKLTNLHKPMAIHYCINIFKQNFGNKVDVKINNLVNMHRVKKKHDF